jgi:hypothetical protein
MRVTSLIELLDAAINTKWVQGPFHERGGIMIVGPPGSFKSTIIESALSEHSDAIPLSDLNVQQWIKLKDDFVSKRYSALGFPEFEKIYQRHPATASNLEGIIKALICEGYVSAPNGDPRTPRLKARALVLGGITTDCFERKYDEWQRNGFLRRFIWIVTAVQNPDLIVQAIRNWEKINFGSINTRPANGEIPVKIGAERSKFIEHIMKHQAGLHGTAYVLIKKITAVLEWKYSKSQKKVDELLQDIAPALSRDGGELVIDAE